MQGKIKENGFITGSNPLKFKFLEVDGIFIVIIVVVVVDSIV